MSRNALAALLLFLAPQLVSSAAWSATSTSKTEIVEENDKTEVRIFCSKSSEREAQSLCEKWLAQQEKTLGNRLLTSYCSTGEMSANSACLYRSQGELKYVLRKYRTETERLN